MNFINFRCQLEPILGPSDVEEGQNWRLVGAIFSEALKWTVDRFECANVQKLPFLLKRANLRDNHWCGESIQSEYESKLVLTYRFCVWELLSVSSSEHWSRSTPRDVWNQFCRTKQHELSGREWNNEVTYVNLIELSCKQKAQVNLIGNRSKLISSN